MTTLREQIGAQIETGQPIAMETLVYLRENLRNTLHQFLLREFRRRQRENGLTRRDLAERIGKRPEQVTRWLGSPANLTMDTLSDLLAGLGAELGPPNAARFDTPQESIVTPNPVLEKGGSDLAPILPKKRLEADKWTAADPGALQVVRLMGTSAA